MNRIELLFVLILSCFAVSQVIGDDDDSCRPSWVRSLRVTDEAILTWTEAPDEECDVAYYLVQVTYRGEQSTYTTEEMQLNVSFVPPCESVTFTVIPISTNDVQGGTSTHGLRMPIPPDANLTIQYIRVSSQDGHVTLNWDLDEEWRICTSRFRVIIYEEESDTPADIYVSDTTLIIPFLVPCSGYILGVTAVHSLTQQGPVSTVRYTVPAHRLISPTVQGITLGKTYVYMEWHIDSYVHNRCAVSSLVVTSTPSFSLAFPITNNYERPTISTNITNLQPEIMYFLNVTVVNTAGPSVPTLISVQTLGDE
ncbi:hypothetical protein NQ317_012782 [Molorchus minor]|uniref:Fibronectin type-III domain-containing protein n=1 Tax=Molorchus minor TaxID=1323400 RepID=A0ABQ9K3H5_9CUCU|nr:hypothetical protein NQ317_012782 [Molorchus minor]